MDTLAFEYAFLWVIILMVFFAFLIGTHKMLQVIIATTFITLVTLWWSGFISFLSYWIIKQNTLMVFGFWPSEIVAFLQSAELTTNLMLFMGLLIYTIQYTTLWVGTSNNILHSRLIQFVLPPVAIFNTIISLSVSILGINIFSLTFLASVITKFGTLSFVSYYVQYLPLFLLIQWLLTLILVFRKERRIEITTYDDI